MISVALPFFKDFETIFLGQTTPDACVGNNLFTFMFERYLMSLTQLKCPPPAFQPVSSATASTEASTSCVMNFNGHCCGSDRDINGNSTS
jgi:hypothetical protein